jgi:hypothetical protein
LTVLEGTYAIALLDAESIIKLIISPADILGY